MALEKSRKRTERKEGEKKGEVLEYRSDACRRPSWDQSGPSREREKEKRKKIKARKHYLLVSFPLKLVIQRHSGTVQIHILNFLYSSGINRQCAYLCQKHTLDLMILSIPVQYYS